MKNEQKGNRLSRRSFLKGLGGGAIGTAVISTGLVTIRSGGGLYVGSRKRGARQIGGQSQG